MYRLWNNQIKLVVILVLGFLSVYLFTLPHTNVAYTDSDLFITVGYEGGLAHAPGYPLYVSLLFLFTHLPLPASIAWKAHFLSGVLHSLTLGTIFLSLITFVGSLKTGLERRMVFVLCFIATASLGGSYLFWFHSIVAEKYALNDLFAALLLFIGLKLVTSKPDAPFGKIYLFLGSILGLSLFHHQTIILVFPSLLFALYSSGSSLRRFWKTIALGLVVSVVISLALMFCFNTNTSGISYHFHPSLTGLFRALSRRDIMGVSLATGESRRLYLMSFNLAELPSKLQAYGVVLIRHFTLPIVLLAIVGGWRLLKTKTRSATFIKLFVLSTTCFVPLYLDWPSDLGGAIDSSSNVSVRLFGSAFFSSFGKPCSLSQAKNTI